MIEKNQSPNRWLMLTVLFLARVTMGFQYQAVAALSPLFADSFCNWVNRPWDPCWAYTCPPGVVVALPGAAIGKLFGDKRVVFFWYDIDDFWWLDHGLWLELSPPTNGSRRCRCWRGYIKCLNG